MLEWMSSVGDGYPLFSIHILSLVQGLRGRFVGSGCQVVPDTGLTVKVSPGQIIYLGEVYNYSDYTSLTLSANNSGHIRGDVIVWNSGNFMVKSGGYGSINGQEIPVFPKLDDGDVPIAGVIVKNGATSITTSDIIDVRVQGIGGSIFEPLLVYEDFKVAPSGELSGNASYDSTNKDVVLVNNSGQSGQLNYPNINPLKSWFVEVDFNATGSPEGLWFYVYCESKPGSYSDQCGGYIINLSFTNNRAEVYYNGSLLSSGGSMVMNDGNDHKAYIVFESRRVRVWVDGILMLDFFDTQRDLKGFIMGIGANTGSSSGTVTLKYFKVSKHAGILPVYV